MPNEARVSGGRAVAGRISQAAIALLLTALVQGCPDSPRLVRTLNVEVVVEGLNSPLSMAAPNDGTGRRFVADQAGLIRVITADDELVETPLLDLRPRMVTLNEGYDERGLLGLALHPDFATNGRFFVRYSAPREGQPGEDCLINTFIPGCHTEVLSEFRVSGANASVADLSSEIVLLRVDQPQFNHNGGDIAFGPDGFLYVSLGDGGAADDVGSGHTPQLGNGQDPTTLLGKILRIDVDGERPYEVPTDNPFVADAQKRPEIWALGFRNPWRFSFDRGGARELFVGDVGQNLFEEVHIVRRGGNYGWNIREGLHCFDPAIPSEPTADCEEVDAEGVALVDPIIEYPHQNAEGPVGIAVIGGYVYRGSDVAELVGSYVFGDYATDFGAADGTIFVAMPQDDTWAFAEVAIQGPGAVSGRLGRFVLGFGEDSEGELHILTRDVGGPAGSTGAVLRIVSATR